MKKVVPKKPESSSDSSSEDEASKKLVTKKPVVKPKKAPVKKKFGQNPLKDSKFYQSYADEDNFQKCYLKVSHEWPYKFDVRKTTGEIVRVKRKDLSLESLSSIETSSYQLTVYKNICYISVIYIYYINDHVIQNFGQIGRAFLC